MAKETVTSTAAELALALEQDYPGDATPREAAALLRGAIEPTDPLTSVSSRDDQTMLVEFRDDEALASAVAWDLLAHDAELGVGLAAIAAQPLPASVARGDLDVYANGEAYLWNLVTAAAEIGYRMADKQVARLFDYETASTATVSRVVAAILARTTVEDEQPFLVVQ